MNDLFPVEVECYSGYKANEYPVRFHIDGVSVIIEEILDRWYQYEEKKDAPAANYFKVRTPDCKVFILKHETSSDDWLLWVKGENLNLNN